MSDTAPGIRHEDREMVPRFLVIAMFALMIGTLAIVAFSKLTNQPMRGVLIEAPIEAQMQITLIGDRAGTFEVLDADGNRIAISSQDKAGFIGVIGRVFDRERAEQNVVSDAPITVVRRTNGNIAVIDETTALTVELIGYGVDNVAAFGNLLN